MKTFVLAMLTTLTLSTATWAYPRPDSDALFGQQNLTEQQIETLRDYIEQHREAGRALRQRGFASCAERRTAKDELREQHRNNLATFLSVEQFEEFDADMAQFSFSKSLIPN